MGSVVSKVTWRPPASRAVTLMQTDPGTPGSASWHGTRATLVRVAETSRVGSAWPAAAGRGSSPRGHRATALASTARAITPTTASMAR